MLCLFLFSCQAAEMVWVFTLSSPFYHYFIYGCSSDGQVPRSFAGTVAQTSQRQKPYCRRLLTMLELWHVPPRHRAEVSDDVPSYLNPPR